MLRFFFLNLSFFVRSCKRTSSGNSLFSLRENELEECVDGFSEKNYIGKFQFGRVYRGTYKGYDVIVKIWRNNEVLPGENKDRLQDELTLHEYFKLHEFHPNMAKLINFCSGNKHCATIYYMNPKAIDTLHNLIETDCFTWAQRIRVAFGIASFIRYMHTPHPKCPSDLPYLIRNIDAAHILVDQDYEALVFDLSMISGGILTDKRELLNQCIHGSYRYSDPIGARPGKWSDKCDVFSFGVVLLSLISKRVHKDDDIDSMNAAPFVYEWAKNIEHKQQNSVVACGKIKSLLVHESLKSDRDFHFSDAATVTKLGMMCVEDNPQKRPTMKQVIRCMQSLHIVRQNANTWECCQMLDGVNEIYRAPTGMYHDKDHRVKLYWQPWHEQYLGVVDNRLLHRRCNRTLIEGSDQSQAGFQSSIKKIGVFSYVALNDATCGFSEKNLIGKYQFGRVFRGEKDGKKVIVKMWETSPCYNKDRQKDEIYLLQHPRLLSHPNLVKMIGYCFEKDKLGAIYDLDPLDSLHNLAPKDEFTWLQRMKVIYEFANLLKFLHTPKPPLLPYRIGNINAEHIILDKDHSPKLLDFGMTVGGIILSSRGFRTRGIQDHFGYVDMSWNNIFEAHDVFAFGCILFCLIHKRAPKQNVGQEVDCHFIPDYNAKEEYEKSGYDANRFSFVHKSLELECCFVEKDGIELTKLGMECIDSCARFRPSMDRVVNKLKKLHVIRQHAQELGILEML